MRVFITGLTGTLGTAIAKYHHSKGDIILGCSRSEERATKWLRDNKYLGTLFLGDCIGLALPTTQIGYILQSVDRVYHTAAMKHVELCESNPHEAFLQNVHATCLISEACARHGVEMVFASSDKACAPQSVYGATKLIGERCVVNNGGCAIRLGNIIASSGSVFKKWAESDTIEVTDSNMTRFFISVREAALIMCTKGKCDQVYIPRLKAARLGDIIDRLPNCYKKSIRVIGRRPGETQNQLLDILPNTIENKWADSNTAERWNIDELLVEAGII